MAWVGQIVRQALQLPQFSFAALSTGKGILTNNSPKKNQDPASLLIVSECLPVQPIPAFSAIACSSTGAESTKGRKLSSAHSLLIFSPSFFKRLRSNL